MRRVFYALSFSKSGYASFWVCVGVLIYVVFVVCLGFFYHLLSA